MDASSRLRKFLHFTLFSVVGLVAVLAVLALWVRLGWSFPAPLPAPGGPHPVGRTEFDWQDESRPDPFDPAHQRELDVLVWYPAERVGTQRAAYIRQNWLSQLNRTFPMPQLTRVKTHSWVDVPVAPPERERWPVVILSSGFGGVPSDYTSFAEGLASWGYIVAAPASTYSGITVVFPDGRIAREADHLPSDDQLVQIWAADIGTVIKHLAAVDHDPHSIFYQKLELSRLGVIGHSFGGAASAQYCVAEPACAAVIDMDGELHGGVPTRGIGAPTLLLVSDGTTAFWSSKRDKDGWAKLYRDYIAADQAVCARSRHCQVEAEPGFRHANFTDQAALFRAPLVWIHPALGSTRGVDGLQRAQRQIIDFLNYWQSQAPSSRQ